MYHENICLIITEFRTYDDLHPFYSDMLNIVMDAAFLSAM